MVERAEHARKVLEQCSADRVGAMLAFSAEEASLSATNQAGEVGRVAASLTETQREAVLAAMLYVSGKWRLHWKYAGEVMEGLTTLGVLDADSSYLNEFGLAVRNHLPALATQPATSQEGEVLRQAFLQTMQGLFLLETAEKLADKFIASLAATPTPPTLSTELRAVLEGVLERLPAPLDDRDQSRSAVIHRSVVEALK
jgi:hypothetical protein